MKNDIIYYNVNDLQKLPFLINSRLSDKNESDFFCFALDGCGVSESAFDSYKNLMDRFELSFAFYPYSESMIQVNRAFDICNPLIEITLIDGSKIDVVRQINYACMFFDRSRMPEVKLCDNLKYAFMEKFVDDLSSIGSIPSNGMFIDVHESWNLFLKYRRTPIEFSVQFNKEFEAAKIKLDNNTSKLMKKIVGIQQKLEMVSETSIKGFV